MRVDFRSHDRILRAVRTLFKDTEVLVIGDILFDRYLWGKVERISPEAPVPVVKLYKRSHMPGGAANVAANLSALGIKARLAGFVGSDYEGNLLLGELGSRKVETGGVKRLPDRPTITKTRIIGGHQQVVRVDDEDLSPYDPVMLENFMNEIAPLVESGPGAVILSDYGKGLFSSDVTKRLITMCRKRKIPVLVDPKGTDFGRYSGATVMTPNQKEFSEALGRTADSVEDIVEGGVGMCRDMDLDFLVVTRGERGMILLDETGYLDIRAHAKDVFDVSGAGDTVIATLAGALACGLPMDDSARLANLAAGIVVGKVGTAPVERNELLETLSLSEELLPAEKVCGSAEELLPRVEKWRREGRSIAFTNGCFDIIHSGHIMYLEQSAREGDKLVVGVNSDASVRRLKGQSRPVNRERDRLSVLAALSCVDAVVLFEEDTPVELIDKIRPDVLIKGNDYTENEVVGASMVKSWGGRVVLVPILEGRSTTGIIERIRNGRD